MAPWGETEERIRRMLAKIFAFGAVVIGIVSLAIAFGGCAHSLGYAGRNPGAFSCDGKVKITGMGTGYLGAGMGGTETNSFNLEGSCEKFSISQGPPAK